MKLKQIIIFMSILLTVLAVCASTTATAATATYTAGTSAGWNLAAADVILQTIYGTQQDASGNITVSNVRAVSIDKGLALAFSIPYDTALQTAVLKCRAVKNANTLQIRMYNVTGMNYLAYGHTMTRANPGGAGNNPIFTINATSPNPCPYHTESGYNYTDLTINFGPLEVTAGQYLLTFDATGPSNTWGNIVRGLNTEADGMGKYPNGSPLPSRAIVTTSSVTGNNYYYQLDSITAVNYTASSQQFAIQMIETIVNHTPVVDAGDDQTIVAPTNSVNLDGTATDDGLPDPPAAVTTTWTKQSGPGTVTFGNASAVDTTATFSTYGTYVLRLTANDSQLQAYDEMTVTYYQTPPQNQAPVVDAGPDQQITLPSGVTLDATVTDDGLPNPPHAVTTTWTKQSGPGTVNFGNASAVDTTATFSAAGTYVLRLTANDSALQSYNELTVIVNAVGGYEGYAPITTGGEGGATVTVTNLNNSGAGSLRAAVDGLTGNPTKIVFGVSGTINLTSRIHVISPYVTIAGETAPGAGITLNGSNITDGTATLQVNTHDVIVRHLRIRNNASGRETIQIDGDWNLIFDHCSISGSADGGLDINNGTEYIIVSRCLIANNVEGHRSYGKYASLHHNYYNGNNRRQPKIVNTVGPYDFRNNVLQYWTGTGTNVEAGHQVNIINNYWGPTDKSCSSGFNIDPALTADVYIHGNYFTCGYDINGLGDKPTPNEEPVVTTMVSNDALRDNVKGNCGALPRDSYDYALAGPANP